MGYESERVAGIDHDAKHGDPHQRVVNEFCHEHLNHYVNFHRPCLFAETFTHAKGRQRK
jgi:hypothetical protein